ncbi:MAG: hypothetical protein EBQ71_17345 [Betaproteobacteria bacterium]|nr:hypothetical protein [Betaproteobacteria bacterium]
MCGTEGLCQAALAGVAAPRWSASETQLAFEPPHAPGFTALRPNDLLSPALLAAGCAWASIRLFSGSSP